MSFCPFFTKKGGKCRIRGKYCNWLPEWPYYTKCRHYRLKQRQLFSEPPNYEDLIVADEVGEG